MSNTKHVFLKDLHFEHTLWYKELSFYEDEMKLFKNRLGDLTGRNNVKEFMVEVEHFENQLMIEAKAASDLKHAIRKYEQKLAEYAQEHPVAIEHVHFADHTGLRERVDQFKEIYRNFKGEFMRFTAKWM